MNPSKQLSFLGIILILLLCLCYFFSQELIPFILSFFFAYLLNPLVNIAESKFRLKREYGAFITVVVFISLAFILFSNFLPVLFLQIKSLIANLNSYELSYYKNKFYSIFGWAKDHYPDIYSRLNEKIDSLSTFLLKMIGKLFSNVLSSGKIFVNITLLTLFVPLITFYLLKEMPKIKQILRDLIPLSLRSDISNLIQDINKTIGNYFRGQLLVCLILGVYYSIAFYVIGLDYPIALGAMTGLLIFIPYFGIALSMIVILFLTWVQFENIKTLAYVIGIFLCGQIIEGGFITPKLLGKSVNLHPMWIIFGIFIGGGLFGFLGVLLAIPLTAVVGVLIRFLIKKYKNSKLYKY